MEGKWLLKLSKSEQLEEMIENEVKNDQSSWSEAQSKNEITDNDEFISALEADISRLTNRQKEELRSIGEGDYERLEELKELRKQRFNTDWVQHDYQSKLEEQKDWQEEG